MSDRDCQHGQLTRVCDRCADAAEIERLRAEIERLNAGRHELQAAGTHPAPCARHCESTAYEIEIRRLRSEVTRLSSMIDHQRDEAIETERMLRAELAACRAREARMREMIDCRTCRNYTRDGCIQTAQCVDGEGYRRAAPVRFWSAALAEVAQG